MLEKTIKESWTLEDLAEFKAKIARLNRPELVRKKFYETCETVSASFLFGVLEFAGSMSQLRKEGLDQ